MSAEPVHLTLPLGTLRSVAGDVVAQGRRSLAGWSLALGGVVVMYLSFWPTLKTSPALTELTDSLPPGLSSALGYDQLGSATGWVSATAYGLLVPVLLTVFAVSRGAASIAGLEETGAIELEQAAPVPRRRLLVGRLVALWAEVVVLAVVVTVAVLAMTTALEMDVRPAHVLAASSGLALLGTALGTVAFAAGAATGRRAVALAAGAAVAAVAYLLDALGPVVDATWMSAVSPWSWYAGDDPVRTGFDLGGLAGLAVLALVAAAVAVTGYERRDLLT